MTSKQSMCARELSYQYKKAAALSFPDFDFPAGDQVLILGKSGSGKTTLLHILSGLLRPFKGTVTVAGQDLYSLPPRLLDQFRGRNIGLVFQEAHLVKSLTVYENLVLAQKFAGMPINQGRIVEVLSSLGMRDYLKRYPQQLSRGQLQRVAISRAVVNKPAVIIADEPTSALDDENAAQVLALLMTQAYAQQATLVIATHDQRIRNRIPNHYCL